MTRQIPISLAIVITFAAVLVASIFVARAQAERTTTSSGNTVLVQTPCNTGSSTLASIPSPFPGATSTVLYTKITGTQGATTTDIVIGTSTASSYNPTFGTSTLAENILGMFGVATGTQFMSVAGQLIGPGTGYNSSAGGTYRTLAQVTLAPNENLLVHSTSTFGGVRNGGIGATQVAIPSSCNIETLWVQ